MDNSFENLFKRIESAVDDMTTLKIVTAVGNVTISEEDKSVDDEGTKIRTEKYENAKAIITKIDLIDGDFETTIDVAFTTAEDTSYSTIYQDHMARIKEGHAIVEKNITTLKMLIDTVRVILAEKPVSGPKPD
ncbi:MAG: hypothetical protein ACRD6Q_06080 [Nitrososphaeraceae archaeon]